MFVKKDLRKIPAIFHDAMKTNNADNDNGDSNTKPTTESPPPLTELRLARRPTEFKNGIQAVLCQPRYVPALRNLVSISLYDCQIKTLDGIGFFASPVKNYNQDADGDANANVNVDDDGDIDMENSKVDHSDNAIICPNLAELNLGRNPIKTLPSELALLSKSLKALWLDDCELNGPLPDCLYELERLEILRVSNNRITKLKDDYDDSGDGSLGVGRWKHLEVLCLDGNEIESLPKAFAKLTKLKSLLVR